MHNLKLIKNTSLNIPSLLAYKLHLNEFLKVDYFNYRCATHLFVL